MRPKIWLQLLGTFVLAVTFIYGGATMAQEVTLRIGTVDTANSHSGVGVEAFAKEVNRLSKGTMEIKVFHAGQLGNIPAQIANVFSGAQDMHLIYPEFLGSLAEEARVISLPYLFNDMDHLKKFYMSSLWKPVLDRLEQQGSVMLDNEWTWTILDPRGFNATRPIYSPADFKGLKLRIWEAKAAIETWKGFGANPVVVPRPEMYLAFKQKIIEGGPETAGVWVDQKNAEHAKYWIRTEEYFQFINIMINKKKFESLTSDQQGILRQATTNAGADFRNYSQANFETKKAIARNQFGGHVIEPALGPWRKAAKMTIDKLIADKFIDGDYIEKIRALD